MIGSPSARHLDTVDPNRYAKSYLASHRALAACTREIARLSDEVLRGVATLRGPVAGEKPTVRRSPDRCIVQLGPVALTVAWLRSRDGSVAAGELLIIVWRGAVAPRQQHNPERPSASAPLGAVPLWERVLSPVAESEETWTWQGRDGEIEGCSSIHLAERCVARLGAAYTDDDAAAAPATEMVGLT